MSKTLQILVPHPCKESWDDMQPSGNGRHCSSCLKTVVDFSIMSDREILSWLTEANKNVCGRFAPEQLNRDFIPAPERKRRAWAIWNFLLAGLLVSSKAPAQTKHPAASPSRCLIRPTLANPMTIPSRVDPDSPKYSMLSPVVVQAYSRTTGRYVLGGATMGIKITKTTRILKDTLAWIGVPKKEKELTLYPNPAARGGTSVRLSLSPDITGDCKIQLYNGSGALLQDRRVEWTTAVQSESLDLPASLPAGVYFIKVSHTGAGKAYTQKLVVL